MPGMDELELMDKLEQRTKAVNLSRQMKSIAEICCHLEMMRTSLM